MNNQSSEKEEMNEQVGIIRWSTKTVGRYLPFSIDNSKTHYYAECGI